MHNFIMKTDYLWFEKRKALQELLFLTMPWVWISKAFPRLFFLVLLIQFLTFFKKLAEQMEMVKGLLPCYCTNLIISSIVNKNCRNSFGIMTAEEFRWWNHLWRKVNLKWNLIPFCDKCKKKYVVVDIVLYFHWKKMFLGTS